MGIPEAMRGKAGKRPIYRREWQETGDPLVAEARAQTLAIQRLQMWLRLAYSALALAALLGYWGFAGDGGVAFGACGIVLGALFLGCVLVLRTGIAHGRTNVNAMLEELEQRKQ